MLSKLVSQRAATNQMVNLSSRAFRASAVANKKPSIGDAVTILQSKVSSINQVVSIQFKRVYSMRSPPYLFGSSNIYLLHRTTLKNSELLSLLVMVLQEYSDS